MMSEPMGNMDKEMKKRQEAMKSRLAGLKSNPVTDQAVKQNQPKKDSYQTFRPVDELVSAARNNFERDGQLKTCLTHLGNAILDLAKSGGLDKGASKQDTSNSSTTSY